MQSSKHPLAVPVALIDQYGFRREFKSVNQAALFLDVSSTNISRVATGQRKTVQGYRVERL